MPLQLANVPFKLTAEDMGVPDIMGALSRGMQVSQSAMQFPQDLEKLKLANAISKIQAQYAPLTVPAEAASKLAYANLMGPQFLAKIMGNQDLLANVPDEQKSNVLNFLLKSGMTQGNMGVNTNLQQNPIQNQTYNKSQNLMFPNRSVSNILSGQNNNLSERDQNNISNMQPGQAIVVEGNQQQMIPFSNKNNKSFAENVGEYGGIVSEAKESGRIRANDIKDLNTNVFNGETNNATLDNVSKILSSPAFEQIRRNPILGNKELSYYAKFGTPEQQNMVGQYYTLTGNIIKDSARDFPGAFRKGEQQLLQDMKPSPSDTADSARGKVESLALMNKLLTERSRLTSHFMSKYHFNKLEASEYADKQINADQIRQSIHNKLNPSPTYEDIKFMANKYNISEDEVKKRLRLKGLLQ